MQYHASEGHQPGSPSYRAMLWALFFIGVATFAQLYSPQGLLPLIATDQVVTADQASLMISAATLGLAVGVIPWSYVGDARGRKPTMVWAISAACLFAILTLLMPSFSLAVVMRFFEGVMLGGVPALAIAYLNEEVSSKVAAAAAGTYIAGTSLGGLSGRLLAVPVGEQLGWKAGMLTVTAVSVASVVAFIFLAPAAQQFVPRRTGLHEAIRALVANLRSPALWVIYCQGFLTMGGFVAMFNYLGFHLSAPPYSLPLWLTSFIFLAYLAGTVASPRAGRLAARFGRKPVLLVGNALMMCGVGLTLLPFLSGIIIGTVMLTAGFFAAHTVASGWAGSRAVGGRAQSASLYNLGYYGGSSVLGFLGGIFLHLFGWPGTVTMVLVLVGTATLAALLVLPRD